MTSIEGYRQSFLNDLVKEHRDVIVDMVICVATPGLGPDYVTVQGRTVTTDPSDAVR